MTELKGQLVELRATIHITRAATGNVDTYEMVGTGDAASLQALMEGQARHNKVHGAAGAIVGPGSGVNVQSKEN